ncbi:MAG: trehalose-phosphatase [Acidimicrobiia bacterium]|nr:trehalose-phosphatase [Acidimicrobiia bacterium]
MSNAIASRLRKVERLLVACDFDGVLAPIVDDPAAARPLPAAMESLRQLAHLPDTHVAIVSGRDRRTLSRFVPDAGAFRLVGSHGAEPDEARPSAEERAMLEGAEAALADLKVLAPGLYVEPKPLSVAVHFRRVDPARRAAVAEGVERVADGWPYKVLTGKEVVEFAVRAWTKGDAVAELRARVGATSTLYLGDDVTDEDAFAVLGPDDVGVKVGEGPSIAGHRVPDPEAVAGLLASLAAARARAS